MLHTLPPARAGIHLLEVFFYKGRGGMLMV